MIAHMKGTSTIKDTHPDHSLLKRQVRTPTSNMPSNMNSNTDTGYTPTANRVATQCGALNHASLHGNVYLARNSDPQRPQRPRIPSNPIFPFYQGTPTEYCIV